MASTKLFYACGNIFYKVYNVLYFFSLPALSQIEMWLFSLQCVQDFFIAFNQTKNQKYFLKIDSA